MTTNQQEIFVQVYLETGDEKLALSEAGYSDTVSASSVFNTKGVESLLRESLPNHILRASPKALKAILGVLDGSETLGTKEKLQAAKDILDRAGFTKTDKVEVKTETPLFILPAKE